MSEFFRPEKENFGTSVVRLEPIDMTKDNGNASITVGKKTISLPVLNLTPYNSKARCYAFIESLQNLPISMIDIIYSDQDILFQFETDENYRRKVLSKLKRVYINQETMKFPGVIFLVGNTQSRNEMGNAISQALQDATGTKIFTVENFVEREEEEQKKQSKSQKTGITKEVVKALYEVISGKKVKTNSESAAKKVKHSINQGAVLVKSGAILTGEIESEKYLISFQTEAISNGNQIIKDMFSFYITGADYSCFLPNPDYLKKFGNSLLNSHILEAFSVTNPSKLPVFSYAGNYDAYADKVVVMKDIEEIFDEMNEFVLPGRNRDEGR